MNSFLKKILLFFIIAILLVLPAALITTKGVGTEVDKAMRLATKKYTFKIRKIRLGDSVGENIWEAGENAAKGEINLTCTQSISIIGHLMLLQALKNNNQLDTGVLIEAYFKPSSILYSNLDQKYTRGYFLKKFYNNEWFFNDAIFPAAKRTNIDSIFLAQYPERWMYKYLYFAGRSLLSSPLFFEKSGIGTMKSGPYHLLGRVYKELEGIKFYSTPVSETNAKHETTALERLSKYMHMTPPIILNDSFFLPDKVHLRVQHRKKGLSYFTAILK